MRSRALRVIGLLSGTSMDGIDAVLTTIMPGGSRGARLESVEAFRTYRFHRRDRDRLRAIARPGSHDRDERARIDIRLGTLFGRAATKIAGGEGALPEIDLIGSHGQTIFHAPGGREGASVQIGSGAVIAEMTGVAVVHDFRAADVAAGGEGAPLLPVTDWLLFRSPREDRLIVNIGGIANLTHLPRGGSWSETRSWDTGPGNALLDRIVRLYSGGKIQFDRGGKLAQSGKVDARLLAELLGDPFFRRRPPKSTGTEQFGDEMAARLYSHVAGKAAGVNDLAATLTELTAVAIGREVERASDSNAAVYLCGGGAHNDSLVSAIVRHTGGRTVRPLEDLGVSADAREAVGFALLAAEFTSGRRYDMSAITGARGAPLLGTLAPGRGAIRIGYARGADR